MNWLRIHVSNLCNFKCSGCHVFELGENVLPNRVMPQEIFDTAIENFTESMNHFGLKETIVSIYGGETLANKKVIKAGIEKYGSSYKGIKLNWVINTNGSLLKEEDVLFFKEHNVELHISVDGREEIHNLSRPTHKGKGTFHMVMPALELVKKHCCRAQINSYMMPSNYLHLKDIVDIAERYGIKKIYLDQFYNTDMITHRVGMEKYREVYFYAMLRHITISGPWERVLTNYQRHKNKRDNLKNLLALDVNIDGSCYVPLNSPETKKMNLRIEDFADFIQKGGWEEVCDSIRGKNDSACGNCPIKDHCYGGAIEQVHYHIGDHADTVVSCDFFRDWINFLTRPVHFKKYPELQVLSVLPLSVIEPLIQDVRTGIQELSKRLWQLESPMNLNVSEYHEEFLAASRQSNLPDWTKAATAENTLYHKGENVTPALIHELTHIFINQKKLKLGPWFAEGVCEWVQNSSYNRPFLLDSVKKRSLHEIVSLDQGVTLIKIDGNIPTRNALYVQAHAFVDYLIKNYFDNNVLALLLPTVEVDIDQHLNLQTSKTMDDLLGEFTLHALTVIAKEVS